MITGISQTEKLVEIIENNTKIVKYKACCELAIATHKALDISYGRTHSFNVDIDRCMPTTKLIDTIKFRIKFYLFEGNPAYLYVQEESDKLMQDIAIEFNKETNNTSLHLSDNGYDVLYWDVPYELLTEMWYHSIC